MRSKANKTNDLRDLLLTAGVRNVHSLKLLFLSLCGSPSVTLSFYWSPERNSILTQVSLEPSLVPRRPGSR